LSLFVLGHNGLSLLDQLLLMVEILTELGLDFLKFVFILPLELHFLSFILHDLRLHFALELTELVVLINFHASLLLLGMVFGFLQDTLGLLCLFLIL
jgi:hypothetical protein